MKILVFSTRLELGGVQVNTAEVSAELRDRHGHDVVLFAADGPMVELVQEKELRWIRAPDSSSAPSLQRMTALREAVRKEKPDLLHVWDWPQCLDAYYSVHLGMRVPMLVTDMTMSVNRMLPKSLPTTFGTPDLVDQARSLGRKRVELMLPPVDVRLNSAGAVDGRRFRSEHGIEDDEICLVTVSRLVSWMKAEGIRRTIEVVGRLAEEFPLKFVVVGEGTSRAELESLGEEVNTMFGREIVCFSGIQVDPRPAYAAADVVLGMGGSGLRGMAFSKPLIVVGHNGFSMIFNEDSRDMFLYRGIYGVGDQDQGNLGLAENIRKLLASSERREALGRFSRDFVVEHFSIENVTSRFNAFAKSALEDSGAFFPALTDGFRTAAIHLGGRITPEVLRRGPFKRKGVA